MSMPRAAVSFLTSCSDSSKGWRGQRPTLNWRPEARAKGYGSMSRLACAACGAEDQIATVVLPAGTNAATEALAGLVERVTFHNEENGFCVLRVKARGQRDLITVLGHAAMISAGEFVQASGAWVNDRTHGVQFRASFLKAMPPTTAEGIEKYLGSGMIRGIGPAYARKLLRAFGSQVFDVIEAEPHRLREVAGIGPKRADGIATGWAEQQAIREIMIFLHANGVGTSRAVRIYKTYGADAI